MTKFRYILIGIVGTCVLILVISISGLRQSRDTTKEDATILDEIGLNDDQKPPAESINNAGDSGSGGNNTYPDASQMIYGLYLPSYDESGNELSVVRSKYTALFEDKIYKIRDPVIEFKNLSVEKGGLEPEKIFITAKEGMMNTETNEGALYGDVSIHLDEGTEVSTASLTYLPDERRIFTDDEVMIVSDKMIIKGQRFEIGLAGSKAWINEDVEMRLNGIDGGIFDTHQDTNLDDLTPAGRVRSPNEPSPGEGVLEKASPAGETAPSYIKCRGQLVFDRGINAITFYDDVHAVIGGMTAFADQLRILFESDTKDTKEIKEIIASGDVLTMDGTNFAKGETLVWDAKTGVTTLEDKKKAEFLSDKMFINSNKIRLYKNNNWVEVPSGGGLITTSNPNTDVANNTNDRQIKRQGWDVIDNGNKIDEQTERGHYYSEYLNTRSMFQHDSLSSNKQDVRVTWGGRMLFKSDERQATFEKDVEVVKVDSHMNCEDLVVTFNDRNEIESLTASRNVRIIERKRDGMEVKADKVILGDKNDPVELTGEPYAWIKSGNKQISSAKIIVFDDGNEIETEDSGNLSIVSDKRSGKAKKDSDNIYLEWQGKMVFKRKKRKASFYDNVQAFKEGLHIKCDRFNVFFNEKEDIEKIVALENVYISSEIMTMEGLGTMLTWSIKDNIAVLTGDPMAEIRKEGSRTLSKKVYFDIDSGQVTWEGRSHWEIVNEKEDEAVSLQ